MSGARFSCTCGSEVREFRGSFGKADITCECGKRMEPVGYVYDAEYAAIRQKETIPSIRRNIELNYNRVRIEYTPNFGGDSDRHF